MDTGIKLFNTFFELLKVNKVDSAKSLTLAFSRF